MGTATKAFAMPVQEAFQITGRPGVVVVGQVERGVIHPGDTVELVCNQNLREATVRSVEHVRSESSGNVGLVLEGIVLADVMPGTVVRR